MQNISHWFFRLAVAYLLAGVTLGIVMAASHDHSLFPVHAHLNLLGWVTMSLFALFYRAWPQAAESRLARIHFWLYVPAHLVQMLTLVALYKGATAVEPVLGLASVLVGAGILCFAVNVWRHTRADAGATAVPGLVSSPNRPGAARPI
jgi:hypothetical protein